LNTPFIQEARLPNDTNFASIQPDDILRSLSVTFHYDCRPPFDRGRAFHVDGRQAFSLKLVDQRDLLFYGCSGLPGLEDTDRQIISAGDRIDIFISARAQLLPEIGVFKRRGGGLAGGF